MKRVDGYVCIAGEEFKLLFGKNSENDCWPLNIETNGYTAYATPKEAKAALGFLDQRGLSTYGFARLRMSIAECKRDLEELRSEQSLVVIQGFPDRQTILMGCFVEGVSQYPLPGSRFFENEFVPFSGPDAYQRAEHVYFEVMRQGGIPTTIAAISLETVIESLD